MLRVQIAISMIERATSLDLDESRAFISEVKDVLPTVEELLRWHHEILLIENVAGLRSALESGLESTLKLHESMVSQLLELRINVTQLMKVRSLESRLSKLPPGSSKDELERDLGETKRQVERRHKMLFEIITDGNKRIEGHIAKLSELATALAPIFRERLGLFGRRAERKWG